MKSVHAFVFVLMFSLMLLAGCSSTTPEVDTPTDGTVMEGGTVPAADDAVMENTADEVEVDDSAMKAE